VVRWQAGPLHYGMVQIVIHDSPVTQIEKTERVRLGENPRANNSGRPEINTNAGRMAGGETKQPTKK
jgi:hypothetical protein